MQSLEAMEAALLARKKKNKGQNHIDNSSLHAGSPMYYYCRECDQEMTLPETHGGTAPTHCRACKDLFNLRAATPHTAKT